LRILSRTSDDNAGQHWTSNPSSRVARCHATVKGGCWLFVKAQCRLTDKSHTEPFKTAHNPFPMPNRVLKTFDAVVEEFGGKAKLGEFVEQDTAAVCNWRRRRKKFPTKFYKEMVKELKRRKAEAPDDLWGFYRKKN